MLIQDNVDLLVDGSSRPAAGGQTIDVKDPSTGGLLTKVADAQPKDVHQAVGGALDAVIDVTGVPATFSDGVRPVRAGGRFVSIGSISPGKLCEFDPGLYTRSGVMIRSAIRYHPWFLGRALEFLSDNAQYPWDQLVDADYSLDDVEQGLRDSAERKVARASIKVSAEAT